MSTQSSDRPKNDRKKEKTEKSEKLNEQQKENGEHKSNNLLTRKPINYLEDLLLLAFAINIAYQIGCHAHNKAHLKWKPNRFVGKENKIKKNNRKHTYTNSNGSGGEFFIIIKYAFWTGNISIINLFSTKMIEFIFPLKNHFHLHAKQTKKTEFSRFGSIFFWSFCVISRRPIWTLNWS